MINNTMKDSQNRIGAVKKNTFQLLSTGAADKYVRFLPTMIFFPSN